MTRREYLRTELHNMLLTTASAGINVRRTFVLSLHKTYTKPYAKSELIEEIFEYERDEARQALVGNFSGTVKFGVYCGFDIPRQDTSDEELLEQESNRLFDIIQTAVENYAWQDATLDNGATLQFDSVYCTGLMPAILDNEMSGTLLVEGVIEYSHYY
jgi:hypothetical protein